MKSARPRLILPALLSLLAFNSAAPQDDPRAEIINLRQYTHPAFTRIVLDIVKLREYTVGELRDPGRIYLDVFQAKLNPILHNHSTPVEAEYISQVRISQKTTSTVRVVVDVEFPNIQSYRVYHLFDPFRLVIDIYPRETKAAAAEPPAGKTQPPAKPSTTPPDPSASGASLARQLGLGVRTVVIDPGHGGPRPGTIGKSGLQEKTVNLDIALALQKLLKEKAGLDAILTRESDIDVPLEKRTVIANQKRADLFVSIHSNAHRDRKRGGVETFYLNVSPDPSVIELAAAENATSTKNIGEMKTILQKIVQNSKIQESRDLAEKIQRNLVKSLSQDLPSIKGLGVKGGPFWVLIGGEMPSVLVEVSHLSNAKEEAKLKTRKYKDLAAQGIYNGILEYIRSLGKGEEAMKRRDFIKDLAATGLALRFGTAVFAGTASVQASALQLAAVEGESPYAITKEAVAALGGMNRFVGKGDKVVIKPNIGWDRTPEMAACTNPDVVKALVELVLEAGAKKAIVIDNTTNQAKRCYVRSGIQEAVKQAGGDMLFVDDYRVKKTALKGAWLKEWDVVLDVIEADKVINVPIAKHHSLCRLTLGMKNWLGAVGGARNQLHQGLDQAVVDLAAFFKPQLTVLDAYRILVRNGPQGGRLSDTQLVKTVVAGTDPVAVDAMGASFFGVAPRELPYLGLARERGLGEFELEKVRLEKRKI